MNNHPHLFSDRFHFKKSLGEGATSFVYLVSDAEDQNNLKAVKISKNAVSYPLEDEVLILKEVKEIDSPYFICYINKLMENNLTVGIVTNYIPYSIPLHDIISDIKNYPFLFKSILVQTLEAVSILHSNHIVHRDIKLENIMLSKTTGKITLIDFGLACVVHPSKQKYLNLIKREVGTTCNFSPEIREASRTNHLLLYQCDVWAIGAIFYTIIMESYIIDNDMYPTLTDIEHFFADRKGGFTYVENQLKNLKYPLPEIPMIIRKALSFDYHHRPSCEELLNLISNY